MENTAEKIMTGMGLLSRWNFLNDSHAQLHGMVPPGAKVLDIGCADGSMGRRLKEEKACTVWGMEIDPQRAAKAKEVLDRVILGDASDPKTWAPIKETFDAILVADVLEHLADPQEFLSRLAPWLKPDGLVIASVPNAGHWTVHQGLRRGMYPSQDSGILDKTHRHFWKKREWLKVFHDSGYTVQHLDYTFHNTAWKFLEKLHAPPNRHPLANSLVLHSEHALVRLFPSFFAYQFLLTLKKCP